MLNEKEGLPVKLEWFNHLPIYNKEDIPIKFKEPNFPECPNHEWETLPHVMQTSNDEWDPSSLDHDQSSTMDKLPDNPTAYDHSIFDDVGIPTQDPIPVEANVLEWDFKNMELILSSTESFPKPPDYQSVCKYFLNAPVDVIKHTFLSMTQYTRSGWITG